MRILARTIENKTDNYKMAKVINNMCAKFINNDKVFYLKDLDYFEFKTISHKSFVRTAKRFKKIAEKYIDSLYYDYDIKEKFSSEAKFIINDCVEKLIKTHKSKPFKLKSAFTHSIMNFRNTDGIIKDIRISYNLTGNQLNFKLLTRHHSKFKRKVNFVMNYTQTKVFP